MVKDEARQSPVRFLEYLPLEGVAEALRSHPRRSQKVLERYSPLILRLVISLLSPTSTSSMHSHVLVGSWCGWISPRNFSS